VKNAGKIKVWHIRLEETAEKAYSIAKLHKKGATGKPMAPKCIGENYFLPPIAPAAK
jgi:hypothetical protein